MTPPACLHIVQMLEKVVYATADESRKNAVSYLEEPAWYLSKITYFQSDKVYLQCLQLRNLLCSLNINNMDNKINHKLYNAV